MAKSDKKSEKKSEKKAIKAAKTEVKAKVSKKSVDSKKPVAAIPSAKHDAPISSKEIMARVCIRLVLFLSFLCWIGKERDRKKGEEEGRIQWRVVFKG
jgi:hypothetical protein